MLTPHNSIQRADIRNALGRGAKVKEELTLLRSTQEDLARNKIAKLMQDVANKHEELQQTDVAELKSGSGLTNVEENVRKGMQAMMRSIESRANDSKHQLPVG